MEFVLVETVLVGDPLYTILYPFDFIGGKPVFETKHNRLGDESFEKLLLLNFDKIL